MKLFKLTQDVNNDYNTYDSVIVAAEDEEEAKYIHPDYFITCNGWDGTTSEYSSWCAIEDVQVKYIGEAKEGTVKGIILASYNAG